MTREWTDGPGNKGWLETGPISKQNSESPRLMTLPTITRDDRDCASKIYPLMVNGDPTAAYACAAAHRELGAREERAQVVEWIKAQAYSYPDDELAKFIERGDHLTKGEG